MRLFGIIVLTIIILGYSILYYYGKMLDQMKDDPETYKGEENEHLMVAIGFGAIHGIVLSGLIWMIVYGS